MTSHKLPLGELLQLRDKLTDRLELLQSRPEISRVQRQVGLFGYYHTNVYHGLVGDLHITKVGNEYLYYESVDNFKLSSDGKILPTHIRTEINFEEASEKLSRGDIVRVEINPQLQKYVHYQNTLLSFFDAKGMEYLLEAKYDPETCHVYSKEDRKLSSGTA